MRRGVLCHDNKLLNFSFETPSQLLLLLLLLNIWVEWGMKTASLDQRSRSVPVEHGCVFALEEELVLSKQQRDAMG